MSNWLDLDSKVVVITGGASGIGKSIVTKFLEFGTKVVVCDLKFKKTDIMEEDGNILNVIMDVSDRKSVINAKKLINSKFGKVDILVNNAGVNLPCLLIDNDCNDSSYEINDLIYDKMMEVNVRGVYICSQVFGRDMVHSRGGVIINVSSECGLEGSEGQSVYAATKNAVNSFTRSWAKELGKYGVRVIGISPGILEETGLRTLDCEKALAYSRGITVEKLRDGYLNLSTIPLGRVGKLEDVANLVCFLSSDKADYIHGVTINISGGKTRG